MLLLARCPGNMLQVVALLVGAITSLFVLAAVLIVEFRDKP